jgi:hypothetical protein
MGWKQACALIIPLALVFLLIYLLYVWNIICGLFATMVCMLLLCSMCALWNIMLVELFVLLCSICEIPVYGVAMEFGFTTFSSLEFHFD